MAVRRYIGWEGDSFFMGFGLPSLGAVASAAGDGMLSGNVLGVGMLVAPFLEGGGERRLAGGDGGGVEEEGSGSDLAVGDAAVAGDGSGRHGRRDAEAFRRELAAGGLDEGRCSDRFREVQGHAPRRRRDQGLRRLGRGEGDGPRRWLDCRGGARAATESGVAGAVEDRDDLLELGDGEISDLAAVELRRLLVMVGELGEKALHGAEPRRRRLLDRHLLVHLRVPQQINGHHPQS